MVLTVCIAQKLRDKLGTDFLRSGLQHRFAKDGLLKLLGIEIPRNPAGVNLANYSLSVGGHQPSNSSMQQVNGSFRSALRNGGSGAIAAWRINQIVRSFQAEMRARAQDSP